MKRLGIQFYKALFIGVLLLNATLLKSQSWTSLGIVDQLLEPNGKVNAMVKDNAGNVYVAGEFTDGGSTSSGTYYVAKFDGAHWTRLDVADTIINDVVNSLCFDAAGNLYAAGELHRDLSGQFSFDERYVAKWDGISWSILGGSNDLNASSVINSICADQLGNIYAAGNFRNAGNSCYVAKWNGTSWTELGGVNGTWGNSQISSICADANGNIYAAGDFFNVITSKYVAKFDGSSWSEIGGLNGLAANNPIASICVDDTGYVYAAGTFTNALGNPYVAKYNGTAWSAVGSFNLQTLNYRVISQVIVDSLGNIFAVGHFDFGSVTKKYLAKWDGSSTWNISTDIYSNTYITTEIICPKNNGEVYAIVGRIIGTSVSDRWFVESNGTSNWIQNITITQMEFGYASILTTCKDSAGNIYVAGSMGGYSGLDYVKCVLKWDGNAWSILGGLPNGLISNTDIKSICSDPAGNIYAEVQKPSNNAHSIAKWDGTSWTYLGDLNNVYNIYSICSDPSGKIYVAGSMTWPGVVDNCVIMYDGTYWTPVGGFGAQLQANSYISSITTDSQGNLYAGGNFSNSLFYEYIAKWDGNTWSELGGFGSSGNTHGINALYCDEYDNIYAGGSMFNTLPNTYILKWNGSVWSQLDGLSTANTTVGSNSMVNSISTDAAGNVYVCGGFTNSDGFYYVAKWDGNSWIESGGANNLRANEVPRSLLRDGNNIYVAGDFLTPLRKRNYLAKYGCDNTSGAAQVSILSNANIICAGSTAVFNATASNAGSNPTYQWYLNGSLLNNNSNSIAIDTLINNDALNCVLISNQSCLATNIDTSNAIIVNVIPLPVPSISFNGVSLTTTTNPVDIIEWQLNGVTIPNTTNLQTYTPIQNGDYTLLIVDSNGCIGISQMLNVIITSTQQQTTSNISIYPNPTSSVLNIDINNQAAKTQIEITDLQGQVLLSEIISKTHSAFDIQHLASGVYFVRFGSRVQKLIKE